MTAATRNAGCKAAASGPCRRCKTPMVPRTHKPPTGWTQHDSRGLCRLCRPRVEQDGTLVDYPRLTTSQEDMLADWKIMHGRGLNHRQAAKAMGVQLKALERAITRARAAGLSVP